MTKDKLIGFVAHYEHLLKQIEKLEKRIKALETKGTIYQVSKSCY